MEDIIEACYMHGYTVWLRFEDGTEGEVALSSELYGPIFEPLKDQAYFRSLHVNPDTGTIEWPNSADFAPEFLYDKRRRVTAAKTLFASTIAILWTTRASSPSSPTSAEGSRVSEDSALLSTTFCRFLRRE